MDDELDGVTDPNKKEILLFKKHELLNTKLELIKLSNILINKNKDIPKKINIDNNNDNSLKKS